MEIKENAIEVDKVTVVIEMRDGIGLYWIKSTQGNEVVG